MYLSFLQVKYINSQKTLELFQKALEYLCNAEYIPKEVKAELRAISTVVDGLIGGTTGEILSATC